MTDLTDAERQTYVPPPCPMCGCTDIAVTWVEVTHEHTPAPDRRWIVASLECPYLRLHAPEPLSRVMIDTPVKHA